LYTYRRCPYAMRARMALIIAGIAFDAFEIVLRDKPQSMLQASPKGTVPVLVGDTRVIEQSWEIMDWAFAQDANRHRADAWWARAQTPGNLALLASNDGEFKFHLDRYKYADRHTAQGEDPAPVRIAHRDQAAALLSARLEQRLKTTRFLTGTDPCAIDLAIFPFVRQFAAVDPLWFDAQPWPCLKAWLAFWVGTPRFGLCMTKLAPNSTTRFSMADDLQLS
ncbi:MAG: glutathione S-transferase, partial [Quisquiliibacterium sp.]